MKALLKVFCIMFIFQSGFSQRLQLCRTSSSKNDFLVVQNPALPSAIVQVSIHIIRKTNEAGDKAVTTSEAINAFNSMRAYFIIHSICLNLIGIDFINQTSYYNYQDSDFNSLINHVISPDAIDIFLLPKKNFNGVNYSGRASGLPGRALVILGKFLENGDGETLPHEMGHCLGLYHTHHGIGSYLTLLPDDCKEEGCAEYVDGSNSANCGDFVEDTPADPCTDNLVNSLCQYTGTSIDPNGMYYNPDINNIMSYTREGCAGHFTIKQGIRMLETISNTQLLLERLAPVNITIQNFTIPFDPLGPPPIVFNQTFTAQNTLIAGPNVTVNPTGSLNLVAENNVVLLPGFKSQFGSHFCAQIGNSCFPVPNFRIISTELTQNNNSISQIITEEAHKNKEIELPILPSNNVIPNPSDGKFRIEIDNIEEIKSQINLYIYNMIGEIVYTSNIENRFSAIDLALHSKGIYFVKIQSGGNIYTEKIIIQ